MNRNLRRISCVVLGAAILLAPGCSSGDPGSDAAGGDKAPVSLPDATEVVDVPVTKPTDPQPVDIDQLPATARAVNRMPGLSADEKLCANHAIKVTLDGDQSIATTNSKMASVLGNSIVACTPPDRLAAVVAGALPDSATPMSEEQRSCVERTLAGDTRGTARFLSAVATMDVMTVLASSKSFETACGVSLGAS